MNLSSASLFFCNFNFKVPFLLIQIFVIPSSLEFSIHFIKKNNERFSEISIESEFCPSIRKLIGRIQFLMPFELNVLVKNSTVNNMKINFLFLKFQYFCIFQLFFAAFFINFFYFICYASLKHWFHFNLIYFKDFSYYDCYNRQWLFFQLVLCFE